MQRTAGPDRTEIAWQRHGSGEPVVLVHGITESSGVWDPIRDRLTDTHEVITLDLRGHGKSGDADRYDLEALAGDVAAVIDAAGLDTVPHLVGHSLGGAVVSALAAAAPCRSVVNVDQSLRFGAFKEGLDALRPQLEDPDTFPAVIDAFFGGMRGPLDDAEWARVNGHRRATQSVVLGVWQLIFETDVAELDAVVDAAVAGYAANPAPYLAVFGTEPEPGEADWFAARIPGATVDVWADHGHYPHLVDPDRFVTRLHDFWSAA